MRRMSEAQINRAESRRGPRRCRFPLVTLQAEVAQQVEQMQQDEPPKPYDPLFDPFEVPEDAA